MKKVFKILFLVILITSCSKSEDEEITEDCNCVKNYYGFVWNDRASFLKTEEVDCTEEVEFGYIDDRNYFEIVCEN